MKKLLSIAFLGIGVFLYAQLNPNFQTSASVQHEICPNNGSIEVSLNNPTEGSDVLHYLFLLPDTTTPILTSSTNTLEGLSAGNYRLKTVETLNDESQERIINLVIQDQVLAFDFSRIIIQITEEDICNQTSTVEVSTQTQTAEVTNYQIIAGPITTAPQSISVFANLVAGTYTFQTTDVCGRVAINQFTVSEPIGNDLSFSNWNILLDSGQLAGCNLIKVSESISGNIAYPLQVYYRVYDPSGTLYWEQTLEGITENNWVEAIPFFNDELYTYEIIITDACGSVYNSPLREIEKSIKAIKNNIDAGCERKNIKILAEYYYESFTLNFLSAPEGFDPADYNADYPGPYETEAIFGTSENPLPPGAYSVELTDSCGNSAIINFYINDPIDFDYPLTYEVISTDCESAMVDFSANGLALVSLIVTDAPDTFEFDLPYDATDQLSDGHWIVNLPYGEYTLEGVDDCGLNRTFTATLEPLDYNVSSTSRPGCGAYQGSFQLSFFNYAAEGLILTSGPADFADSYPIDVSHWINEEGSFTDIIQAPIGTYEFQTTNSCGQTISHTLEVVGEETYEQEVEVFQNCGSFNISVQYSGNVSSEPGFRIWLQQWNESLQEWTYPNSSNPNSGINLNPQGFTNNINYTGLFRVVKRYFAFYGDECSETLYEFEVFDAPEIISINSCNGESASDVWIEAEGMAPIQYRIIELNGEPFLIDNGDSPVFNNLEDGLYKIEVIDACGNITNAQFSLTDLNLPAISVSPVCEGAEVSLSVLYSPYFTYEWTLVGSTTVLSTESSLDLPNFSADQEGEYQVTIYPSGESACSAITLSVEVAIQEFTIEFDLVEAICENSAPYALPTTSANGVTGYWIPSEVNTEFSQNYTFISTSLPCETTYETTIEVQTTPIIDLEESIFICADQSTTLDAGSGFDTYLWSTGATTQSIEVSISGVYSVEANTVAGCTATAQAEVIQETYDPELISIIQYSDYIEIINENAGDFEYSSDGIVWQLENIFYAPYPEPFVLHIRNVNTHCSYDKTVEIEPTGSEELFINVITPNSDGKNDVWNLANLSSFLGSHLKIYDRYGKIIHEGIISENPVWDGIYLNEPIPSQTYWYVITTTEGTQHKGYILVKNRYKKDYNF